MTETSKAVLIDPDDNNPQVTISVADNCDDGDLVVLDLVTTDRGERYQLVLLSRRDVLDLSRMLRSCVMRAAA